MKIKHGDRVKVLAGKDFGKEGFVSRVLPKKNKVIVDGVHMVKKHERQSVTREGQQTQGGIVDRAMPIDVSNVAVICDKDGPTRLGYSTNSDGKKIRVCKKCGEEL